MKGIKEKWLTTMKNQSTRSTLLIPPIHRKAPRTLLSHHLTDLWGNNDLCCDGGSTTGNGISAKLKTS